MTQQQQRTPLDPNADFDVAENGRPKPTFENMRLALCKLGATLRLDEFANRIYATGVPGFQPGELSDAMVDRIQISFGHEFRLRPHYSETRRILHDEAHYNGWNPLTDYLSDAQRAWDGVPRIDKLLSTYFAVESTPYVDAIGALKLIAGVRRAREPGVKHDEIVVLQGPQGCRKSTAVRILAVREEWFTDNVRLGLNAKETIEQLGGKWVIEIPELAGMRRSEVEAVKAFASRTVDRARPAYGRYAVDRPRTSVFIATTNSARFLGDATGNRRWLPICVGVIDTDALQRDVDLLWGEAAAREAAGASIQLDPSLWGAARDEQAAREVSPHAWVDVLGAALEGIESGKIQPCELWKLLGKTPDRLYARDGETLGECMDRLGWRRVERARFADGSRPRGVWMCGCAPADNAPELIVVSGKVVLAAEAEPGD